jgi:hypothetical protein
VDSVEAAVEVAVIVAVAVIALVQALVVAVVVTVMEAEVITVASGARVVTAGTRRGTNTVGLIRQ